MNDKTYVQLIALQILGLGSMLFRSSKKALAAIQILTHMVIEHWDEIWEVSQEDGPVATRIETITEEDDEEDECDPIVGLCKLVASGTEEEEVETEEEEESEEEEAEEEEEEEAPKAKTSVKKKSKK